MVKPTGQMELSREKELALLRTARTVFEEKGFSGTRMQAIADRSGMSKATLHYYFRSKENLFDKVFDEAISEFIPVISTWEMDDLSWEEKVVRFTGKLVEFIEKGSMLFIIREINRNPELITKRAQGKKKPNKFVAYFEALVASGAIRPVDPKLLYIFINSLCFFPSMNSVMFREGLRLSQKQYEGLMAQYAEAVASFFIHALKPTD
jgi:AcrR family transcriptional regulator